MKNAEKERIISSTIINVLLALIFMIFIFFVIRGYGKIPNTPTDSFVKYAGPFLSAAGVIGIILSYIRKKQAFMKYAVYLVIVGAVLFLVRYSFLYAPFNIGYYIYYSLMGLTVIYIIAAPLYATGKIRRS